MMYDVTLSNGVCIFDEESGFETIAQALKWAKGRGPRYVIQIGRGEDMGISISCAGGKFFLDNGDGWEEIPESKMAEYVARYI